MKRKHRYFNKQPIGAFVLSPFSGILVYEPDVFDITKCDYVSCYYDIDGGSRHYKKHKVHVAKQWGGEYIKRGGCNFYLSRLTKF